MFSQHSSNEEGPSLNLHLSRVGFIIEQGTNGKIIKLGTSAGYILGKSLNESHIEFSIMYCSTIYHKSTLR